MPNSRQVEQRVARAVVAERVELGDEVAELAVGVDEVEDARSTGSAAGPVAPARRRRGLDAAPMPRAPLPSAASSKPAKKSAQRSSTERRVGAIAPVLLLDVVRVGEADELEGVHGPSF